MEKRKYMTHSRRSYFMPIGIFILTMLLRVNVVSAQQAKFTVKVYQQDSTVIKEGTVYLLTADSKVVGSSYWMDGVARVDININQTPIIRLSSVGFSVLNVDLSTEKEKLSDGNLDVILKPTTVLQEVMVSAQRKPISREGNKLVFQVSQSSFSIGGTADELLKKTPMIYVGSDGTASIVGKGPSTVLLDGIPVNKEMLQSIPSSNIEKIEIIDNPGAKYDASGAGVINIVSKKNRSESSYAVIDGSVTRGRKFRESMGVQTGAKFGRWKLDGKYRYYPSKLEFEDTFTRTIEDSGTSKVFHMNQDLKKNKNIPNRHSFSLGTEVQINENIEIHTNGTYNHMSGKNLDVGINNGTSNGEPEFRLSSLTDGNIRTISGILNYGLTWNSSNKKHKVSIEGSNTWYDHKKNDLINESLYNDNISSSSKSNQNINKIDLKLVRADYVWKFNQNSSLNFGLKNISSRNRSRLLFSAFDNGEWKIEENEYNSYKYNENILSGYTSFEKRIGKLGIETGVRMEMTDASGLSQVTERKLIDSNYVNFFPSIILNYAITDNWNISGSYQKRITRPQYQILNPYRLYIDSLSVYSGNPLLKAEQTDYVEGALFFKKLASLKINYSRTKNSIQTIIRQMDNSSLVSMATYENLDLSQALNVTLSIPYQIGSFTTYNVVSYTKNFVNTDLNGLVFNLRRPFWFFYSYNDLKLPGAWSVELTGTYNTSGLMGIFAFQPKLNISAGIRKGFIQNKLTVHLSANDIFNKDIVRTSTSFNNFALKYRGFEDNRYLRLSVSYNLGNLKNLTKSKTIDNRIKIEQ